MQRTATPRATPATTRTRTRPLARSATTALVFGAMLAAAGASPSGALASAGSSAPTQPTPSAVGATIEQCVTSGVQSERSATFTGEMTATAGTARMAMRIDIEERAAGDAEYHALSAPGLGVWRVSDPKVKVYKYLKQVTNLSVPASYRALVRFRWIGAKGHVIRRDERLTPRCLQPPAPVQTPTSSAGAPPTQQATSTAGA